MNRKSIFAYLALPIGLFFQSACGPYSFSGSANSHIKTVAVPVFEDNTAEFGVKEDLANSIIDAFNRDNTLKIANRRTADALISGTVLAVNDRAGDYDRDESVSSIQVHVTVEVKYEDLKKRKVLWEDQLSRFGTYAPDASEKNSREDAIAEAIALLTQEVLDRSVSGW